MGFRVVLDTSVLVPAALRDTLLRAAVRDLYEVYWSEEILDELEEVLAREGFTSAPQAKYLRETLENQFPNAKVPDSYRNLIPVMENDEGDRHVLAAAVLKGAQTIVTSNIRDFPEDALKPYGIEAQRPDTFLVHLYYIDPEDMCESIIRQTKALKKETIQSMMSSAASDMRPLNLRPLSGKLWKTSADSQSTWKTWIRSVDRIRKL